MYDFLEDFEVDDMRSELAAIAKSFSPKTGKPMASQGILSKKTSTTNHYYGPGWVDIAHERQIILAYPTWHMQRILTLDGRQTCDGIQYHLLVGSKGQVYWARELDRILWHCANEKGNNTSIAIQYPVGYASGVFQPLTAAQWETGKRLNDALAKHFGFTRKSFFGHREWAPNVCPGDYIFPRLVAFRNEPLVVPPITDPTLPVVKKNAYYKVTSLAGLKVRTSYSSKSKQAVLNGVPLVYPYDPEGKNPLEIGAIVYGENIGGNDKWAWLRNGQGFMSMYYLDFVHGDVLIPEQPKG